MERRRTEQKPSRSKQWGNLKQGQERGNLLEEVEDLEEGSQIWRVWGEEGGSKDRGEVEMVGDAIGEDGGEVEM